MIQYILMVTGLLVGIVLTFSAEHSVVPYWFSYIGYIFYVACMTLLLFRFIVSQDYLKVLSFIIESIRWLLIK